MIRHALPPRLLAGATLALCLAARAQDASRAAGVSRQYESPPDLEWAKARASAWLGRVRELNP